MIQRVKKPVVTTMHTIHRDLTPGQQEIIRTLADRSRLVIAMTEESATLMASKFDIPVSKIRVIRHGIPEVPFVWPETSEFRMALKSPLVFVSAGHLRPSKGYDLAFRALTFFREHVPDFRYLILGRAQTHVDPSLTEYRATLEELARTLGIDDDSLVRSIHATRGDAPVRHGI